MRKKIIAGNWKMNKTPSEAVALINELKPLVQNEDVDVVFCVPAISIVPAMEAAKVTNINIGAENMYFEESCAYTGAVSYTHLDVYKRQVIGEDGGSLSQGQKQLLCIARVMLCLPPMLILDEATSLSLIHI